MNYPISNPATLILIIIGVYLSVKQIIFLFTKKAEKSSANKYLGTLILVFFIYYLPGILYRFDLLAQIPHVIGLQTFTQFLMGPFVYFYVVACTQEEFEMKPILWLHFVPFILDLLSGIPFLAQSASDKLLFYQDFVSGGKVRGSEIILVAKAMHSMIYFTLALWTVRQYRNYLPTTASYIEKTYHLWLTFFVVFVTLPIFTLLVIYLTEFSPLYSMFIIAASATILLIVIDLAIAYKPEIFQTFPQRMQANDSSKYKYGGSKLEEHQKEKYLSKLKEYVRQHKPYTDQKLTLGGLSEQLNIPAHHLSQVINEKLKVNFLDYINQHRVESAKKSLLDPAMDQYTIIAIAYEAGFNSKSTFYAVFKKHTGQTPNQFKKYHLKST